MAPAKINPERVRAFKDAESFYSWLGKHHLNEDEIWIKIHKVDSEFKSITPKKAIARRKWLLRRGNCFLQDTLTKSVHGLVGTRCKLATLRREDALVYRAGLLNKTGPVEVTLRDKLNDFAHLLTKVGNSEKYSANDNVSNSWFQVFRFGRPAPITSSFFWTAGPL